VKNTRTIAGHHLEFTHLEKVWFPDSGISKAEILEYYERIAPRLLPYTKDRPLTMHRFPDGIEDEGFYHQEVSEYFPDWIPRAEVKKEGGHITHVLCDDVATLLYTVNLGSLVPHVWLSRADRPEYPDRILIDLDPPDGGAKATTLRAAALRVRDALVSVGLTPFVATTGSSGYHVYAPVARDTVFDEARAIVRRIAAQLVERYPDELTIEQRKDKRGERIYLDTIRNSYGHTAVAPYAVRARKGAPVATPLSWDELESEPIEPTRYTIKNMFRRLGQVKDPWSDMDHARASAVEAARRLSED